MDRVIIEFDHHYPPYRSGEVAGFPREDAERILGTQRMVEVNGQRVAQRIAHRYDPKKAAPPAVPSNPPRVEPVAVRFDRVCGTYQPGEVAAFPPLDAQALVMGGVFNGTSRSPVAHYVGSSGRSAPSAAPSAASFAEASARPLKVGKGRRRVSRIASKGRQRPKGKKMEEPAKKVAPAPDKKGVVDHPDKTGMVEAPDKSGTAEGEPGTPG